MRADRAAGRGQGDDHADTAVVGDVDRAHHSELDDVLSQLGVDDGAKLVGDLLFSGEPHPPILTGARCGYGGFMKRVNLAQAEFKYPGHDPDGFVGGMVRPGPDFGAKTTGVSSYELPPGQALCPYHYEWGEEEWLLVIEGRPTLRDPDGEHELQPMDLVFFRSGPRAPTRFRTTRPTPCAL